MNFYSQLQRTENEFLSRGPEKVLGVSQKWTQMTKAALAPDLNNLEANLWVFLA